MKKPETDITFPLPARQEIAAINPKLDPNAILRAIIIYHIIINIIIIIIINNNNNNNNNKWRSLTVPYVR